MHKGRDIVSNGYVRKFTDLSLTPVVGRRIPGSDLVDVYLAHG